MNLIIKKFIAKILSSFLLVFFFLDYMSLCMHYEEQNFTTIVFFLNLLLFVKEQFAINYHYCRAQIFLKNKNTNKYIKIYFVLEL